MRSGKAKFKQLRHFAASVCITSLLLGCASMPGHGGSTAASTQSPAVAALLKKARAALDGNDMQTAQADFARASQLSDDPDIAEQATGLALALHDSQAAQASLARWQALGAGRSDVLRVKAQIALDQGNTGQARDDLMQLTADGKKSSWQTFGKIVLNARDAAQAGQLLKQVATPDRLPDDVVAWLAMSEIGQKLGQFEYAQQIADAASKRFHDARAYAWSADLYAQRGDNKMALAMYAKAVQADPGNIDVRMAYAGLVARDGDMQRAGDILAKGPQDERTFAARTAYAARAKDLAKLRRIYEELRDSPQDLRKKSYYLLGQLAALVDKPEAAIDWLARVPAKADHGIDAGIRRASLLLQTGHPGQAHAVIADMRQQFAGKSKVVFRLDRIDAELYMQHGDYDKAAAAYTRAMAGKTDSSELLYGRGLAYAEGGHIEAAIADLRAVLRLSPDDVNALNALGYTLADAGRNLAEARRLINRALKARPDDPAIIDSWGWLQYRLGHVASAEKALRRSWDKRKDPDVGAHLARVLLARGKRAEARRIYREALKLDPGNRHLLALKGKIQP